MMNDDHIPEARNLTKGAVAVREVSPQVRCGTVHALSGPNGAGKSTMVELLNIMATGNP